MGFLSKRDMSSPGEMTSLAGAEVGKEDPSKAEKPYSICRKRNQVLTVLIYQTLITFIVVILCHLKPDKFEKAIILVCYFIIQNAVTLIVFWHDKQKPDDAEWRTSELTLHILTFFAGLFGALLGILVCRNKSEKATFYCVTLLLVPLNFAWPLLYLCIAIL